MSKHEIIQAYIRGEVDRRGFIAKLATLGVSAGAAAAYATQFAPSVSASAPGGFVVRAAQTQDADYGTTVDFPDDAAAVAFAAAILDALTALFAALANFTSSDFAQGVFEQLTDFASENSEQADALKSLSAVSPVLGTTMGLKKAAQTDPAAFLADLDKSYNTAVQNFNAVVPATDSGETRQTLSNISHAVARQAGVVSFLNGGDGTPNGAFEDAKK